MHNFKLAFGSQSLPQRSCGQSFLPQASCLRGSRAQSEGHASLNLQQMRTQLSKNKDKLQTQWRTFQIQQTCMWVPQRSLNKLTSFSLVPIKSHFTWWLSNILVTVSTYIFDLHCYVLWTWCERHKCMCCGLWWTQSRLNVHTITGCKDTVHTLGGGSELRISRIWPFKRTAPKKKKKQVTWL